MKSALYKKGMATRQKVMGKKHIAKRHASTDKFSMTSGTSGVYVAPLPEPATLAALSPLSLVALARRRRRAR